MYSPVRSSPQRLWRYARALRVGCGLIAILVIGYCIWGLLPNPPPSGPFQSGGLGLTRAEWQQRYVVAQTDFALPFTEPVYEDRDHKSLYGLDYWPEGWLNGAQARITTINPFGWGPGPFPPAGFVQQLLPADSQRLRQDVGVGPDGRTAVDIYYSASLATRYPPRLGAPDPWQGTRPGTFYVFTGHSLIITIPWCSCGPLPVPTVQQ